MSAAARFVVYASIAALPALLSGREVYDDDFGAVVYAQGEFGIAQPAGNYHVGGAYGVPARRKFGQQPLPGRVQPLTYERYAPLSAVSVSAENEVVTRTGKAP